MHPLRIEREKQNLSVRALAARLRLGPTTVARWEQGIHVPTRLYAQALASALGLESAEQVQQLCREWRKQQRGTVKGAHVHEE